MRMVRRVQLVAVLFAPAVVVAQDAAPRADAANVAVHLKDGSFLYGHLERRDADSLVIVGASGRIALPAASVRAVANAGAAHATASGATEYWFPNANATRLFFGPTGRTLGAGQGYFADHELVVGSAAFGVTDRIMIGGGGLMTPNTDTWFVTPKIGLVRGDNVNIAVGALFGGVGNAGTGGVGYLAATFGGLDQSVTVSVGNGFSGGVAANGQVVMLGAERRVSRRISLVTENYLLPRTSDPIVSYGLRILTEKMAVDLAFMNVASNKAVFPGIPYVDFVVRF
jgi:hypothetical protein